MKRLIIGVPALGKNGMKSIIASRATIADPTITSSELEEIGDD
jgi:hypothetical protein